MIPNFNKIMNMKIEIQWPLLTSDFVLTQPNNKPDLVTRLKQLFITDDLSVEEISKKEKISQRIVEDYLIDIFTESPNLIDRKRFGITSNTMVTICDQIVELSYICVGVFDVSLYLVPLKCRLNKRGIMLSNFQFKICMLLL